MLNDNQIKKALYDEKIKVFYYFYKDTNGNIVKFNEEKSFIESSEFSTYLYSDRLKITLGPVIKPLKRKRISSKYRFKNQSEYFDMSKSGNTYVINPGESIIILTNERIVLDGCHSVLIIPRVSLSEVGIIVTAAYIDPYYNGLLRLNVSNNSQSPYELKTLETIAQCFFFELPDEASKDYASQFSQKSVFLGQNWKAIFNEDRPPFPVKKNKVQTNPFFDAVKYSFHAVFNFINKNALITAVISALVFGWAGYKEILSIINLIPHIQSNIKELFEERNPCYSKWEHSVGVFNSNNEIIGILLAYNRTKDDRHNFDSLYIHRLAVKKEYQKRGIGTKLIKYFINISFESNCNLNMISIQTNKEIQNQHVIDFYRNIGFEDRYCIQYPDKLDILMVFSRNKYLAVSM